MPEGHALVRCRGSRGRQAFVFARFPNNLGMIAFHVFQAIPFLYELRELLDWCAAPRLSCRVATCVQCAT